MFTLRAPTKKKRKRKSVSPSPSPSPSRSPTPPPARPQARNLRKKVYVSDVFHQKVSQLAHERQESFSQVVSYLLNTNNPDAAPLPAATPTAPARDARLSSPRVALVEVDQFKTLFQYIHCKEHHLPCRCQLTFRGLSPYVKATCSEGCAFTFWGTTPYVPPQGTPASKGKISPSLVANQLVFALSLLNISEGEFSRFCLGLGLPTMATSYFTNFRSRALRGVASVWTGQERGYQELCQAIGDTDLEMDGSFSQRRSAEHCFVSLLSSKHLFLVLSAVGSRKELHVSSQGLELELSTSAIVAISESPLNPTSITHDEHTGVTKMLNDNAHLIPGAEQRHDGWHRKRHTGKYLTTDLEKLGLSKLAVENIVNKVVMLLNSAFYLHRGQPQEFAAALQKIPTYFTEEEEETRAAIAKFLSNYFPVNNLRLYVSDTSTSSLEGLHGHHQLVGKSRYLLMYKERTYLHNLIWNSARLSEFTDLNPDVPIPASLLQRDDWIRSAQSTLGLAVNHPESEKAKKNRKKRLNKKIAKKAKPLDPKVLVQTLFEEPENEWV